VDKAMNIIIDTWLYGELASYAGDADQASFANIQVTLPEGSLIRDLLAKLDIPTEKRGITFINGNLSALPEIQPDLDHILLNTDRVAFFHLRSMWPYQYRQDAAMISELSSVIKSYVNRGIQHTIK